MLPIAVATYFLLVVGLSCLLFFPATRPVLAGCLGGARRCVAAIARALRAAARRCTAGCDPTARRRAADRLQRKRRTVAVAAATVLPSLIALEAGPPRLFELDVPPPPTHSQIARLLEGEQLVPPPPLPPEIFTTREVTLIRPEIAGASRNWALLDDDFRRRLLRLFELMRARHGREAVLLEGYRSPARQAALAALGPQVTRAEAGMSYHQHGLAADIGFLRDGRLTISEHDPWTRQAYDELGALAETLALTWGGRWQMRDLGHVELRRAGVLGRTAQ